MTAPKTRLVIRWPSAAVLIIGIVAVACVYIFVPDETTRNGIAAGAALVFALVLAFMRRILGVAVVALALTIASCTPAQKDAFERVLLSALELGAKVAGRVLLNEAERALKFGDDTSGGESP